MSTKARELWAVVPAAGVGRRMQAEIPKQYLPLQNKTILENSLQTLLDHPHIAEIVVVLHPEDQRWSQLPIAHHPRIITCTGGDLRCHSVLHGLGVLEQKADPQDWVLVHDAVRPCLSRSDLERLLAMTKDHPIGGILGLRARDTLKRSDPATGELATLPREHIWHAQTPQVFRFGKLKAALENALTQELWVTDEASALEHAGEVVLIVEGSLQNIKITTQDDLVLAERWLSAIA